MKTKPQPHDSRFGPKSFLENKNFPLDPVKTYSLLSFLGIHVVYDISRNPGDRVVKLEVLCTQCRVPSYEPLRMDKEYKVILPSFLVSGGDGFRMIKDEKIKHDSGKLKCLFLSLTQRNRTDPRRGAAHDDTRRAKPETRSAPTLSAPSHFVRKQPRVVESCPSPALNPSIHAQGKRIFT